MYYLRARYLNPNTDRFWTMDTLEGDQGRPLTLNKYLYVVADPPDNRDSSGNGAGETTAVVDVLSNLGGMRTSAIGSSPNAFLSASPYGHGGPDITAILDRTLADVAAFFTPLSNPKKEWCGSAISTPGAGNSWDIKDLRNLTPDYNYLVFPALFPKQYRWECGTGLFKATVAVKDEVYDASAVNFAIYGKMNRLVYDYYLLKGQENRWYSLAATKARVRFWKRFINWDWNYDTGYTAEAFTAWGYEGDSLPKGYATRPSGETVNANAFEWRWMPYHP
jgi:hypothetical protein